MISINCSSSTQAFKKSHHWLQCTFQLSWQYYVQLSWGRLGVLALGGHQILPNSTRLQLQVKTAVICYSESWVPVIFFRLARASDLYALKSNSSISTPIENWTHVYMKLFTRNSPYYHFLKYLLFLLKHPVWDNNKRNKMHNSHPWEIQYSEQCVGH
jgi:hypothetical protein